MAASHNIITIIKVRVRATWMRADKNYILACVHAHDVRVCARSGARPQTHTSDPRDPPPNTHPIKKKCCTTVAHVHIPQVANGK